MYAGFRVRNFRCFADLKLEHLKRLNIVTGRNNVGKTALLEALWIHYGFHNPELEIRVDAFRGYTSLDPRNLADDLFRHFDISEPIRLEATLDEGGKPRAETVTVEISQNPDTSIELGRASEMPREGGTELSGSDSAPEASTAVDREIIIKYSDNEGRTKEARAQVRANQVVMKRPDGVRKPTGVFLHARRAHDSKILARRLTGVIRANKLQPIIDILQIVEPKLTDLRILYQGDDPVVYADVGMGQLMPYALLGGGMQQLLEILASAVEAQNGILLVDEIENGFHHSVMARLWAALGSYLREPCNVQLVATTHSFECLRAACQASEETTGLDLAIHRLERLDGRAIAVTLTGEMLRTAMESDWEVR